MLGLRGVLSIQVLWTFLVLISISGLFHSLLEKKALPSEIFFEMLIILMVDSFWLAPNGTVKQYT